MSNICYNVNCLKYMKQCEDDKYDLCIIDPPYGLGIDGQREVIKGKKSDRKYHKFKGWDNKTPDKIYFDELFRISKNQIIFGINYFIDKIDICTKGWVIWDKTQRGLTMSDCEIIFTSFNKPTRIIDINRVELLKQGTIHPVEKPIKLYKWLLKNYAKPGQKIFDSHVGSGSIRIACYDMGFDFEGCELDPDYWQAQEERFQAHIQQNELFEKSEYQKIIYEDE